MGHRPPHPQLLSMKEASNKKTQRVTVTYNDPLYDVDIARKDGGRVKLQFAPIQLFCSVHLRMPTKHLVSVGEGQGTGRVDMWLG